MAFLSACSGGSGTTATAGDADACIAAAQKSMDGLGLVPPSENPPVPTTPVDAKSVAGSRVAILSGNNAVPPVKENVEEVKKILDLAGVRSTVFDTKAQTTLNNQLMAQAIAQKYDAIYTFGMDITSVTAQVLKAKDAGIPVIESGGYPNDPGVVPAPQNLYAAVVASDPETGTLKADYALTTTGCSGKYAVMTIDYPTFRPSLRTTKAEIGRLCPWCEVKVYQIDFASDIVGSSRSNALAAVSRQPGLKAILTADVWLPYQVPAVKQVANGKNVQFHSEEAASVVLPMIESGEVTADVNNYTPSAYQAWLSADLVLRALTHMDAKTGLSVLPLSLITEDNISAVPSYAEASEKLEPVFKSLWGLS